MLRMEARVLSSLRQRGRIFCTWEKSVVETSTTTVSVDVKRYHQ